MDCNKSDTLFRRLGILPRNKFLNFSPGTKNVQTVDKTFWVKPSRNLTSPAVLLLQALPYVCLLIAMLFFIYAIIGMQVRRCPQVTEQICLVGNWPKTMYELLQRSRGQERVKSIGKLRELADRTRTRSQQRRAACTRGRKSRKAPWKKKTRIVPCIMCRNTNFFSFSHTCATVIHLQNGSRTWISISAQQRRSPFLCFSLDAQ